MSTIKANGTWSASGGHSEVEVPAEMARQLHKLLREVAQECQAAGIEKLLPNAGRSLVLDVIRIGGGIFILTVESNRTNGAERDE